MHPIRVRAAVEPSNILWENLEVSKCERRLRRTFVMAMTALIIILSIALIYYVKTSESALPTDKECADEDKEFDKLSLTQAKATLSGDTEEFCWCKKQTTDDLQDDDDINDYCSDYLDKLEQVAIIKIFSACGVVAINFIIKIVLISLSRFERASTLTKETLKIMTKVFVAMLVNTAFISLIVFSDLTRYEFLAHLGPFEEYVFNGEFDDFSRFWYVKVGATITTTMVISIFSPHLINMCFWFPLGACKRRFLWKYKKT
jgi:hypothetical protein